MLSWAGIAQLGEHLSHSGGQFRAPPMPGHRYVEENSLAAILATKGMAGATPDMNLREHVIYTPLPSMNKVVYSGFETQWRHH